MTKIVGILIHWSDSEAQIRHTAKSIKWSKKGRKKKKSHVLRNNMFILLQYFLVVFNGKKI